MNKYQRFIPPLLPLGHVAAVSVPALLKVEPSGNTENGQLADRENDSGRLTATGVRMTVSPEIRGDALELPSIGTPTVTSRKVIHVPSAASGGRPGDASHGSRAYACPKCSGPVKRLRRRFIDRLVSLITPVRRYRCSKEWDWGCGWEGNLRVHSDMPLR